MLNIKVHLHPQLLATDHFRNPVVKAAWKLCALLTGRIKHQERQSLVQRRPVLRWAFPGHSYISLSPERRTQTQVFS